MVRIIRTWHRDVKGTNVVGKIAPIRPAGRRVPQTLSLWEMQCLQNAINEVCLYT